MTKPNLKDKVDTLMKKALNYASQSKFREGLSAINEALQLNPNHEEIWYNKGLMHKKLGEHEEAINSIDECLKINPTNPNAIIVKGNSFWALKDYDKALGCFEQAIKINPSNVLAWKNKKTLLESIGRIEEAHETEDDLIDIYVLEISKIINDRNFQKLFQNIDNNAVINSLPQIVQDFTFYVTEILNLQPHSVKAKSRKSEFNQMLREYPVVFGFSKVKIPKWDNKGLTFFDLGNINVLRLADMTDKVSSLVGLYETQLENIKMFVNNNKLIASIENYPGAFQKFQKTYNITPIEVQKKKETRSEQYKFCPACGSKCKISSKFCTKCGSPFKKS